ncbi:MAG TPA: type II toxin-antitoxin system RelE/ParE family toxin [Bacillota bacterium]|nr:type II toxin-antitoxin system RelE/ParE family toxin [Bacillota bacterium]
MTTVEFDKQWARMGLNDNDLWRLEQEILKNPQIGPVIPGTGRLRKVRFAIEGKGKSGSVRVVYVDFVIYETVYFIYAYPKKEQDNLTDAEKHDIKKLIDHIEKALR